VNISQGCFFNRERQLLLYTLAAVGASGPTELTVDGVPAVTMKEFDWRPTLKEGEKTYKRARHLFDEFLDQIALNTNNTNSKGTISSMSSWISLPSIPTTPMAKVSLR
jgi:hypothetical protein